MRLLTWTPCLLAVLCATVFAQDADKKEPLKRGLVTNTGAAAPGYTLISPFDSDSSYLLDVEGKVLHTWTSKYDPGLAPYLLPNGHLLRGIQLDLPVRFEGGGRSGGLQEFTWEGELVWEFHLASDMFCYHHDVEPLPNGNLLVVAWEAKSREEALARGRIPTYAGERGLWPCFVLELEPLRPYGARVVWEWHMWDHLIQDIDSDLPDYGPVFLNPGRLNINFDVPRAEGADDGAVTSSEASDLAALGYLAGGDDDDISDEERRRRERADWLHINGIDYNAELDQIALSSWQMSEVFIIDHSTTTEEARGSTGGRSGRGGEILYRWGNPANYQMGDEDDRVLFHQHNVEWVPDGYPGAGHLTIFNNGRQRPDEEYSNVLEIVPPLQDDGTYALEEGLPYGPEEPAWSYDPPEGQRFYASFISGAHRLANGNTLVCEGPRGRVFEVDPGGDIVWEYNNPFCRLEPGRREVDDRAFSMFRATRIPPDHPGLAGRDLTPLDPQPRTHAELLAEQPAPGVAASGWQPLFDEEMGLSKWVNVNCAEGQTFELRDNPDNDAETILFCTGKPTGILRSDRMYENFIVEFEYRHMEESGNAGFFVWADPLPAVGGPFTRGIEVQVCNLGNGDWFTSHGDIFPIWGAVMTPDPRFRISGSRSMPNEDAFHANPTGEWNHFRITAVDGAITLEVNGHLVTAGAQCRPSKGYLCLESEGGEVHFRGLQLWELPAGTHAAGPDATAREATGDRTLYSGLDLEGWTVKEGQWEAADWRLLAKADPATLERELPAGTTHYFFDFKRAGAPAGGALPFSVGSARVPATGEQVGQWNRVHVLVEDARTVVEFGGQRHELPNEGGRTGWLTLVNDGVATEFCSLFARQDP